MSFWIYFWHKWLSVLDSDIFDYGKVIALRMGLMVASCQQVYLNINSKPSWCSWFQEGTEQYYHLCSYITYFLTVFCIQCKLWKRQYNVLLAAWFLSYLNLKAAFNRIVPVTPTPSLATTPWREVGYANPDV